MLTVILQLGETHSFNFSKTKFNLEKKSKGKYKYKILYNLEELKHVLKIILTNKTNSVQNNVC